MTRHTGHGILLDVEGTTSSISFVYNVLFPFARSNVKAFLKENWHSQSVVAAVDQIARDDDAASLKSWHKQSQSNHDVQHCLCDHVNQLMDQDVKTTGLKQLQGLIWRQGFESGQLTSHVYADVPPALRQWHGNNLDIRIYSSGSIMAQKLFFAHTEHGDLLHLINGHFDTTIGPKKHSVSYTTISHDMNFPANQILFISDVVAELDAAATAGLATALSIRPGNPPNNNAHTHPTITSFDQIEVA